MWGLRGMLQNFTQKKRINLPWYKIISNIRLEIKLRRYGCQISYNLFLIKQFTLISDIRHVTLFYFFPFGHVYEWRMRPIMMSSRLWQCEKTVDRGRNLGLNFFSKIHKKLAILQTQHVNYACCNVSLP